MAVHATASGLLLDHQRKYLGSIYDNNRIIFHKLTFVVIYMFENILIGLPLAVLYNL